MDKETEPPREPLRFKPREFERLNAEPAPEGAGKPPTVAGAQEGAPVESPKTVFEILRQNATRDTAGGWYRTKAGPDKARRRRHMVFWSTLLAVDVPLALLAWFSGHSDPVPFVLAIAAMAFFTGRITWLTWFLRTD